MTLTVKNLVACVALSTVCFTSTAHAADTFNKFGAQPAAATQTHAAPYTVVTYSKTKAFNKKRTLKRVVEPVKTDATFLMNNAAATSTDRFNKMATQEQSVSRAMPVLNKRAVTIR
ncbi:hypothetical protein GCM10009069_27460 [Algimonas arctica]|uniref:Uncharacterized protein n=1 Tax=Algimonas arctica TaxID=1479486 RepID=A0A8J3CTD1_9PROT|nr:hypothetical protein [Algimonas arctica]GHB03276.1 hypothetical protein GCM10009069_27460 [Algimonas arctica]